MINPEAEVIKTSLYEGLTLAHLDELRAASLFFEPYFGTGAVPRARAIQDYDYSHHILALARSDETVIGSIIGGVVQATSSKPAYLEIGYLAVARPYRRNASLHLGSHLVNLIEQSARQQGANRATLMAMQAAFPFWHAQGYQAADPRDPHTLSKTL